jgi:hypothetical protein
MIKSRRSFENKEQIEPAILPKTMHYSARMSRFIIEIQIILMSVLSGKNVLPEFLVKLPLHKH